MTTRSTTDDDQIAKIASDLGTTPDKLRRVFRCVDTIDDYVQARGLSPEETANALVTVLANTVALAPKARQADVLTSIFHAMYSHLELPVQ
jgi:hypothetical protein